MWDINHNEREVNKILKEIEKEIGLDKIRDYKLRKLLDETPV